MSRRDEEFARTGPAAGAAEAPALIELERVFMEFPVGGGRRMQAGHDLSLRIDPGDMIAVVGESGCGKSTLGRICLGVQRPSRGKVRYDGVDITDPAFRMTVDMRRAVQIVHQDSYASLNPVKTVFDTLSAPLLHHRIATGAAEARRAVADLLAMVGLSPPDYFMFKYPFQLSGGQRQRVSIARATILRPRAIVADEPVSAVDASLRLSLLELMRSLNRDQGIAFLYITHDLATARFFAPRGRLIVMYLGRMIETGCIDECVTRPGHPYLRALIGAIPVSDPRRAKARVDLPLKSFDMPSATDPPPGCVFHPRCPHATEICEREIPPLEPSAGLPDRRIACHHKDAPPSRGA